MLGKPNGNSLEGRLLAGLNYVVRSSGARGIVYTSRPERIRTLYAIYSDGQRVNEVVVNITCVRLNFRTQPASPPVGSPALEGHAAKWPAGGVRVEEANLNECRKLLLHHLASQIEARSASKQPAAAQKR